MSGLRHENIGRFACGPRDVRIEIVKPNTKLNTEGNDDLKPCPFCGETKVAYEQYDHGSGPRWRCWCTNCTAGIDPGWAQNRHTVRDLWNRRIRPENDPLTLSELKNMAGELVWVETPGIREYGRYGVVEGVDMKRRALLLLSDFTCHEYGNTWLAYRRKPEGDKHEAD